MTSRLICRSLDLSHIQCQIAVRLDRPKSAKSSHWLVKTEEKTRNGILRTLSRFVQRSVTLCASF